MILTAISFWGLENRRIIGDEQLLIQRQHRAEVRGGQYRKSRLPRNHSSSTAVVVVYVLVLLRRPA